MRLWISTIIQLSTVQRNEADWEKGIDAVEVHCWLSPIPCPCRSITHTLHCYGSGGRGVVHRVDCPIKDLAARLFNNWTSSSKIKTIWSLIRREVKLAMSDLKPNSLNTVFLRPQYLVLLFPLIKWNVNQQFLLSVSQQQLLCIMANFNNALLMVLHGDGGNNNHIDFTMCILQLRLMIWEAVNLQNCRHL